MWTQQNEPIRITVVTLLKFLPVLAVVTLVFGLTKIFYVFRARAMRAFAARWGFTYIGLPAPKKWREPFSFQISPPLPGWFSLACHPSGRRIRQIWNLIEGYANGVPVLIFDSVIGEGRGSATCTVIACHTEQNPFGIIALPDRVIQSGGWTAIHGVWFLYFSWTMGIKRLDRYVKALRVGSGLRP